MSDGIVDGVADTVADGDGVAGKGDVAGDGEGEGEKSKVARAAQQMQRAGLISAAEFERIVEADLRFRERGRMLRPNVPTDRRIAQVLGVALTYVAFVAPREEEAEWAR